MAFFKSRKNEQLAKAAEDRSRIISLEVNWIANQIKSLGWHADRSIKEIVEQANLGPDKPHPFHLQMAKMDLLQRLHEKLSTEEGVGNEPLEDRSSDSIVKLFLSTLMEVDLDRPGVEFNRIRFCWNLSCCATYYNRHRQEDDGAGKPIRFDLDACRLLLELGETVKRAYAIPKVRYFDFGCMAGGIDLEQFFEAARACHDADPAAFRHWASRERSASKYRAIADMYRAAAADVAAAREARSLIDLDIRPADRALVDGQRPDGPGAPAAELPHHLGPHGAYVSELVDRVRPIAETPGDGEFEEEGHEGEGESSSDGDGGGDGRPRMGPRKHSTGSMSRQWLARAGSVSALQHKLRQFKSSRDS